MRTKTTNNHKNTTRHHYSPTQWNLYRYNHEVASQTKVIIIYAGVIDPDYRGDINVLLYNNNNKTVPIQTGDHIAQLIFQSYCNKTHWTTHVMGTKDLTAKA
jgi:dUTPase